MHRLSVANASIILLWYAPVKVEEQCCNEIESSKIRHAKGPMTLTSSHPNLPIAIYFDEIKPAPRCQYL